jgi:hypothetical protein
VTSEPAEDDVGPEYAGELARNEFASARRDSRCDRPAGTPIPDFDDAIAEIGRSRRAAIIALLLLGKLEPGADGNHVTRQNSWEQSELARAERDGDFAWINGATLWALHSALDALVEQNAPAVVGLLARIQVHGAAQRVAAEYPDLAAQLPDGALEAATEAWRRW